MRNVLMFVALIVLGAVSAAGAEGTCANGQCGPVRSVLTKTVSTTKQVETRIVKRARQPLQRVRKGIRSWRIWR